MTHFVLALRTPASEATCGYCRDRVGPTPAVCPCGAVYHRECTGELERCGSLGCLRRFTLRVAVGRPVEPRVRCTACYVPIASRQADLAIRCAGCAAPYHPRCAHARPWCRTPGCLMDLATGAALDLVVTDCARCGDPVRGPELEMCADEVVHRGCHRADCDRCLPGAQPAAPPAAPGSRSAGQELLRTGLWLVAASTTLLVLCGTLEGTVYALGLVGRWFGG